MSKKPRQEINLNVGVSSLLFIFVILCLVSFATLSLSSAMSDYRLSERVLTNSEAYYEACNEAEEQLATFDDTLASLYATGISRAGYYDEVGKTKSFAIPVTDVQTLEVSINILYPEASGEPFYEVSTWELVTTGDLEYDDSLNVLK